MHRRLWMLTIPFPIMALGLVAWSFDVGLMNNTTPSLPMGLYVRDDRPLDSLRHDDIVAFCPPPAAVNYEARLGEHNGWGYYCPDKRVQVFLKKVAAVAGDRVTLSPAGISVNGQPPIFGTAPLRYFKDGDSVYPLPAYQFGSSVVPHGKVWAYSHQWFGLDSRYYGPVTPLTRMRAFLVGPDEIFSTPPPETAALQRHQF